MNEQILRELGLENINSNEELVERLLEDKDAFEKLAYALEVYSDEIETVREDMKSLDEEYDKILNDINSDIEAYRNEANKYVREYNQYSRELAGYDSNKRIEDNAVNRLNMIEKELNEISHKETLLNGRISKKLSDQKEKLQAEKIELIQDKESYEKWKAEAKENYDREQENKKAKEKAKEDIINEKVSKKLDLTERQTVLLDLKKEYQKIQALAFSKFLEEKNQIDDRYNDINDKFVNESDNAVKAAMGQEYLEAFNKKVDSDKKFTKILNDFGMTLEEFDRLKNLETNTVDDMIKYYRVVDPAKADDLYLQSKIWEKAGLKKSIKDENFNNWKAKNGISDSTEITKEDNDKNLSETVEPTPAVSESIELADENIKDEVDKTKENNNLDYYKNQFDVHEVFSNINEEIEEKNDSIPKDEEVVKEENTESLAEAALNTNLYTTEIDPIKLDKQAVDTIPEIDEFKDESLAEAAVKTHLNVIDGNDKKEEVSTENSVSVENNENNKTNEQPTTILDYWDMMYPGYKKQYEKELENKDKASELAEQEVAKKLESIPNVGTAGSLYSNKEIAPGVYGINPDAYKVTQYDENGMPIVDNNTIPEVVFNTTKQPEVKPVKEDKPTEPVKEESELNNEQLQEADKKTEEVVEEANEELASNVSKIFDEIKNEPKEEETLDLETDQKSEEISEEEYDPTADTEPAKEEIEDTVINDFSTINGDMEDTVEEEKDSDVKATIMIDNIEPQERIKKEEENIPTFKDEEHSDELDKKINTSNSISDEKTNFIVSAINAINEKVDGLLKNTNNNKLYASVADYMELNIDDSTNRNLLSRTVNKARDYFDRKGIKVADYLTLSKEEQAELLDKAGVPKQEISKSNTKTK